MLYRTPPRLPCGARHLRAYTHDALPGGTAPHWGEPDTDNDVPVSSG